MKTMKSSCGHTVKVDEYLKMGGCPGCYHEDMKAICDEEEEAFIRYMETPDFEAWVFSQLDRSLSN